MVKPGDTLSQIAVDYGVSLDAIARANGIDDPSAIYVGQKFEIPGCGRDEATGPIDRTVYNDVYNEGPVQEVQVVQGQRPEEMPLRTGPMMRPSAEEHLPVEQPQAYGPQAELTYVVQPGDMLSWIAQEHNVDAYTLATYNGIDNLNFIYTGQVLVIPN